MADGEHRDEGDGSLRQLVKDLTGSREMMSSLMQALIPGLMEQLKSGEVLNELLQGKQTPAQKVTSRENLVSSNLTSVVTTPTPSGTVMNSGNAAGSNNSTAAVWSNAAHQGNAAQVFPWPQGGPSQFCPMYPPMYPWHPGFHPMGMPQSSLDGAGPSSLGSGAPSSASVLSDSDTEINPFIDDEERDELLGDIFSEEDDEDEQKEEDRDGPPPAKWAKFMPSVRIVKILKAITERPIKNEKRKSITNKYPLPSCDYAHTPNLDDDISCIVPKSAKTYDRYLSKLQQFSLDALGPMVWLHEQMLSEGEVDPTKAKEAVEASIALLGSATAHFSMERRKSVMKHMNKDLRPLCEGKFPKRGPHLFGEDFGFKAKKMADNIRALKGVSTGKDCFSRFGGSNKGKQPQSRRFTWGKNAQTSQSSVFNRLGPSKQNFKFQRSNQHKKQ